MKVEYMAQLLKRYTTQVLRAEGSDKQEIDSYLINRTHININVSSPFPSHAIQAPSSSFPSYPLCILSPHPSPFLSHPSPFNHPPPSSPIFILLPHPSPSSRKHRYSLTIPNQPPPKPPLPPNLHILQCTSLGEDVAFAFVDL